MSEHTKEPWTISSPVAYGFDIYQNGDACKWIGQCHSDELFDGEEGEGLANARRIVACVNACAGISDETLAEWGKPGGPGMWGRAASRIKAQRDELLAALQMALADHMTEAYLHPLRDGTVEAIRCAIANAEKHGA